MKRVIFEDIRNINRYAKNINTVIQSYQTVVMSVLFLVSLLEILNNLRKMMKGYNLFSSFFNNNNIIDFIKFTKIFLIPNIFLFGLFTLVLIIICYVVIYLRLKIKKTKSEDIKIVFAIINSDKLEFNEFIIMTLLIPSIEIVGIFPKDNNLINIIGLHIMFIFLIIGYVFIGFEVLSKRHPNKEKNLGIRKNKRRKENRMRRLNVANLISFVLMIIFVSQSIYNNSYWRYTGLISLLAILMLVYSVNKNIGIINQ